MIRITIETEPHSEYWEDTVHPAQTIVREYDTSDVNDAKQWFLDNAPFDKSYLLRAVWEVV